MQVGTMLTSDKATIALKRNENTFDHVWEVLVDLFGQFVITSFGTLTSGRGYSGNRHSG